MNSEYIVYPTKEDITQWLEILKKENTELKLKLPIDSDDWYDHVLSAIDRINNEYTVGLYSKATKLFYNINKGHNFVDGNKRSSIVITYLFLLLNCKWIIRSSGIETLAKEVARSKGSTKMDYWMQKIENKLIKSTIEVPE